MTPEQQAAYVNAQSSCAIIEALGMMALNTYRKERGETIAYDDEAFFSLIDKYGISHNAVLDLFQR